MSDILNRTLASVLTEIERLDPANLVAARARGVLDATASIPQPMRERPPPRQFTEQQRVEIPSDYAAGMSADQIGAKHGVDRQAVYRLLDSLGVERRPTNSRPRRSQPDARLVDFIARRERGETMQDIATAHRITRERVRQIFAAAGLNTSPETLPLTPPQIAAVENYLSGASLDQVACAIGASPQTIHHWITRAGAAIRPASKMGLTPETKAKAERAAQLYRNGLTTQKIAAELGLSKPEMVYRFLAIAGVRPSRQHRVISTQAASAAA